MPSAVLLPDSGANVGMGHTSRCIALGQALSRAGWRVSVVADDPVARLRIRAYRLRAAGRPAGRWDVAVVDSYRRPLVIVRRAQRWSRVVAGIDDLHQLRASDVDLVIRPSIGERSRRGVIGGAEYVLLRPDFLREVPRRARRATSVRRVVISLGSYPPEGMLERVADLARDALPRAEVVVASGVTRGRLTPLADQLARADVAIVSGGQTLNEVIALGRPALVLTTAGNQVRQITAAARAGAIVDIGIADARGFAGRLRRALRSLDVDVRRRRRVSTTAAQLLDGHGARRVARALAALVDGARDE